MASNNLRVIYRNLLDISTTSITGSSVASSTYTPISNTQKEYKSRVWRTATSSTTSVNAAFVVTLATATSIQGLILAFCNLSSSATIRVRGFTGTTAPTVTTGTVDSPVVVTTGAIEQFDSGAIVGAPPQNFGSWNWGIDPLDYSNYNNIKVYARVWLDYTAAAISCTSYVVEIYDPSNTDKYIEVSRIIMGNYWSPRYNTSYGLSSTIVDMSTNSRTEAGDLVTFVAPYYNTLTFDLKYMNAADRTELYNLIRTMGIRKPFFITLFPSNSEDWGKEQIYQCYGKLVTIPGISHDMFEIYSSQISIEEV